MACHTSGGRNSEAANGAAKGIATSAQRSFRAIKGSEYLISDPVDLLSSYRPLKLPPIKSCAPEKDSIKLSC